jgi:hypothetical protein
MTDPCEDLRRQFEQFKREQEKINIEADEFKNFSKKALARPLIHNVVGELLLFIVKQQPRKFSNKPSWFTQKHSDKSIVRRITETVKLFPRIKNFKAKANDLKWNYFD